MPPSTKEKYNELLLKYNAAILRAGDQVKMLVTENKSIVERWKESDEKKDRRERELVTELRLLRDKYENIEKQKVSEQELVINNLRRTVSKYTTDIEKATKEHAANCKKCQIEKKALIHEMARLTDEVEALREKKAIEETSRFRK